jgi:predicted RNase H-related nuclease YkuK (DUF458 family)
MDVTKIKNEKNGEVRDMTKMIYAIPMSGTDNSVGPALLECYKVGNFIEKLKNKIMIKTSAEIEERPTNNGCKFVIKKIDNVEL